MAGPDKTTKTEEKTAEGKPVRVRRARGRSVFETEVVVGSITAGDEPVEIPEADAKKALAARDEDGRPYLELVE